MKKAEMNPKAWEIAQQRLLPISTEVKHRLLELRQSFTHIACDLLSDFNKRNPRTAQIAVSLAAREILDYKVFCNLIRRNRKNGVVQGGLTFRPQTVHFSRQNPGQKRHLSGWSDDEFDALVDMALDRNYLYRYVGGMHDGKLCYPVIVDRLNELFSEVRRKRSPISCSRFFKREVKPFMISSGLLVPQGGSPITSEKEFSFLDSSVSPSPLPCEQYQSDK